MRRMAARGAARDTTRAGLEDRADLRDPYARSRPRR